MFRLISKTTFKFSSIPMHKSSALSVLGLRGDPSFEEIKKAYFLLSKRYHPDINESDGEKFKEISEAYSTLKKLWSDVDEHQYTFLRNAHFNEYQETISEEDKLAYLRNKRIFEEEDQHEVSLSDEEEKLYKRIFGRSYKDDPKFFYDKKNHDLREMFENEMEKMVQKEQYNVSNDQQKNAFVRAHEHCRRGHHEGHESQENLKRMRGMFAKV